MAQIINYSRSRHIAKFGISGGSRTGNVLKVVLPIGWYCHDLGLITVSLCFLTRKPATRRYVACSVGSVTSRSVTHSLMLSGSITAFVRLVFPKAPRESQVAIMKMLMTKLSNRTRVFQTVLVS